MDLLPQDTANVADSETRNSAEDPGGDDDAEEIPQAAHENAARELIGQKAPRERCGTNEPNEEPDIGSEVLYGGASQLVKLGKNWRPLLTTPELQFSEQELAEGQEAEPSDLCCLLRERMPH